MTENFKHVLAVGLLNLQSSVDMVTKEQEKALAAGFIVKAFAVRPGDDKSLEEFRDVLKSQHWDGVSIGFGVRGNRDFTGMFEKAINMCLEEVQPTPKLLFSSSPDDVFGAIQRVFLGAV